MTQPLESYIRNIPDFPIPGIQFKDITTLLRDGAAMHRAIDVFVERYRDQQIDALDLLELDPVPGLVVPQLVLLLLLLLPDANETHTCTCYSAARVADPHVR